MGAGAVGSYYGALLARDGHAVTMVARGPHLDALRSRGVVVVREADGRRWEAPVTALARPGAGPYDLAIVTTKSHHTLTAAEALRGAIADGTLVLSLQNGMENVGRLASVVGVERVLGGIAFVGLRVEEPGVVRHEAQGWVRLGHPTDPRRTAAAHEIVAGSWEVSPSRDIVRDQWHKLLWNAGFNAICAVTGATAGEALATPESERLVREAMHEVVAVAAAHGVTLTDADVDEMAAPDPAAAPLPALHGPRPGRREAPRAGRPLRVPGPRGGAPRGAHAGQRRARRPARAPGGPHRLLIKRAVSIP